MNFHYPSGKKYKVADASSKQIRPHTPIQFGKRGMSLEDELNESNQYYLSHGIAVVHKKPTPIQIVKVDYPKRSAAVIKEAYFRQASTTDYNGVYKGYYLDFDAKETKRKTAFPLDNFHDHQIRHMKACLAAKGICFTIIKFVELDQIFLLPATNLFYFWDRQKKGGRKSIPLSYIKENGYLIKYHLNPLIPYLNAVDNLLIKQHEGEHNAK
ncbi:Holliday junction resolvase RecU [Pediococcus ethanolidurans]|uniref:Holliday junction resolvase RecU n=1 Tax=Pediococcus ethanolidurans TaxID=319653 RepID=A0A0R2K8X2_9LACO|nr:Holliday junction resolvase RecU [Pediococcus ethanolidurans]KRN82935.1 recombination protein U [Pediococcus ethanolidurans]MBU7555013.1 Holliday junction resolvase RecU [Pediococcus ethanolidurans]MCV3314950.1 Holliday junction resolvase RecU [Pediococcus ethanolidurans]MCV3326897.1 Holliday junction resolvase RecU [Pediococcus ethanolidurans]SER16268.1 recombination protein U [Pediococcus ethanolidurans]